MFKIFPPFEGITTAIVSLLLASAWSSADAKFFQDVSVGSGNTCSIDTAGILYCWGLNNFGQVGDGSFSDKLIPTAIDNSTKYKKVEVGSHHACALTELEKLKCWGRNENGQLGDSSQTLRQFPTSIDPSEN